MNFYTVTFWRKILKFYDNVIAKYPNTYTTEDATKDALKSKSDSNFLATNISKDVWKNNNYNVVRNKSGWYFAYYAKENNYYYVDAENYRNMEDYQTSSTNQHIKPPELQVKYIPTNKIYYGHRLVKSDNGLMNFVNNNGQLICKQWFNNYKTFKPFGSYNIFAYIDINNRCFALTLDGRIIDIKKKWADMYTEAKDKKTLILTESKLYRLIKESVKRIINEKIVDGKIVTDEKQLGRWHCTDGLYMDHPIELNGKIYKFAQDVRWYEDTDRTLPTICLFRKLDDGKYLYAYIDKKNKEVTIHPISRSIIPLEILKDFHTLPLPPQRVLASPAWRKMGNHLHNQ